MPSDSKPSVPTTTRRTLLEWLGCSTVLALSSPLIVRCAEAGGAGGGGSLDTLDALSSPDDAKIEARSKDLEDPDATADGTPEPGSDAGVAEVGDDAATAADGGEVADAEPEPEVAAPCEDGFTPGSGNSSPVLQGWGERTVDPQDLAQILSSWSLRIDGLVETPRTLSFCDLLEMGLDSQVTDFHCVEGWSILDVPWDGIRLSRLLDLVGPLSSATHLKLWSVGGTYTESLALPIALEIRTLLGLGIGGETLPLKHGFPCRVVVPRLLGYKNPKYVERIELVDAEHAGYWSNFGYAVSGEVSPERLRPGKY
jgi:hypothetical protein